MTPAISVSGSIEGVILPDFAGLGGSRIGVGFHQPYFSEQLSLAALGGSGSRGDVRWLEGAASLGYRLYYSARFRSHLGATFAFAREELRAPDGRSDAFNVRAAAAISLDVRVIDRAWLSLSLEPGGVLLDSPHGTRGAWLGAAIAITYDTLLPR